MLLAVQRSIDASRNANDVGGEQLVYDLMAFAGFAAFMLLLALLVVDSAVFEGEFYQAFENATLVDGIADSVRKDLAKRLDSARRFCACSCRRRASGAAAAAAARAKVASKAPPAPDGRRGRSGGDGRVALVGAALRKHRNTFVVENPMQLSQIAEASRILSVMPCPPLPEKRRAGPACRSGPPRLQRGACRGHRGRACRHPCRAPAPPQGWAGGA